MNVQWSERIHVRVLLPFQQPRNSQGQISDSDIYVVIVSFQVNSELKVVEMIASGCLRTELDRDRYEYQNNKQQET